MNEGRILVDALQASDTTLKWKETNRRDASQYYGGERGAPMRPNSLDRIPKGGIGDEYCYELPLQGLRLSFLESIYNSCPFINNQHLHFRFDDPRQIADEGSALFNRHYAESKMMISVQDVHDSDKDYAVLKFMNVPFAENSTEWGKNDNLTPSGIEFMNRLFDQRDRLLAIAGLSDPDHETFRKLLIAIERAFRSEDTEKFHVGYWST